MITKKIVKRVLTSLLLLMALSSNAQVSSNHSLSMTLLGLEYSYEHTLAAHWSLIGRAGVASYGYSISMYPNLFQTSWTIAPDRTALLYQYGPPRTVGQGHTQQCFRLRLTANRRICCRVRVFQCLAHAHVWHSAQ